ncbi:unnamed protein product [Strongylus vulgaris]|uniref:Uncharacterized protein n=1 Tax=Strongylus vulgaris TaxID=40348 RepID=A0A3P7LG32_STRVU|nr:unnamed protein product [Strongylus vulgaris]
MNNVGILDESSLPGIVNPPAPVPIDRPPFLLEAPDDVVAEYFKITMDEKLTKGELKLALQAWKASLPPFLRVGFQTVDIDDDEREYPKFNIAVVIFEIKYCLADI